MYFRVCTIIFNVDLEEANRTHFAYHFLLVLQSGVEKGGFFVRVTKDGIKLEVVFK